MPDASLSRIPESFPALIARDDGSGTIRPEPGSWPASGLGGEDPPGGPWTEIEIDYSCLNFKDALSATGNRGVSPNYPHIPGIDAFGRRLDNGEEVIITGFDFGMGTPGGFGRYARVPDGWLISRPQGLGLKEAAAYGTAGVTAAMCIDALVRQGVQPGSGPVAVSGATGGVGSIAVAILAGLGYEVHAVTGKPEESGWLRSRGAAEVLDRKEFVTRGEKALLRPVYAGAVDTAGGAMLHRILRSLKFEGAVAACGMVAGTDLDTNIFPFILRGTSLIGIASADSSRETKQRMWNLLASEWKIDGLEKACAVTGLAGLPGHIDDMLAGNITGRFIVDLTDKSST
jgi:acrylyl-CoA reductase (NADPH)